MALHSRKTMFAFQEDASKIENKPLNFERCSEYAGALSEDQLRLYIVREMENFRNQGLNDVSPSPPSCTVLPSYIVLPISGLTSRTMQKTLNLSHSFDLQDTSSHRSWSSLHSKPREQMVSNTIISLLHLFWLSCATRSRLSY